MTPNLLQNDLTELLSSEQLKKINQLQLENLPISFSTLPNGEKHILSYYRDKEWVIQDKRFPLNTQDSTKVIRFNLIPNQFVDAVKFALKNYDIEQNPAGQTIVTFHFLIKKFTNYLNSISINSTGEITPLVCANYVNYLKTRSNNATEKPLSKEYIHSLLLAVEKLYENLKGTKFAFENPWPESSAAVQSGLIREFLGKKKPKTSVISDHELKPLIQRCYKIIEDADGIMDLKSKIEREREKFSKKGIGSFRAAKLLEKILQPLGYKGLEELNFHYDRIKDAVAIIILAFSGIRSHELCAIQIDAYRIEKNEFNTYYWLKSTSTKTYEGNTEWLVPEIVIRAINVQKKLSQVLRNQLINEMHLLLSRDIHDPRGIKIQNFKNSLFLIKSHSKNNQVNPLSSPTLRNSISVFGEQLGIHDLSPHRFRRTFAVYVARSIYGDLRYLKEHFKHWSIDMTLLYADNDSQSEELIKEIVFEIKNHKIAIVQDLLDEETVITGGLANNIISYRSKHEAIKTYQSRQEMASKVSDLVQLRATGHSWCTSELSDCGGRSAIQATTCIGCSESIIEKKRHGFFFRELYLQQLELRKIEDIGEAGKQRVERDIQLCERVLKDLGMWEDILKER